MLLHSSEAEQAGTRNGVAVRTRSIAISFVCGISNHDDADCISSNECYVSLTLSASAELLFQVIFAICLI